MDTYKEFIENILNTRGRFNCGDEYHEKHHIKPQCLGGTNNDDNLIDLYAHEHFIAHKLLALENPTNEKLIYAWWMMAHVKSDNQEREVSPMEYEEAKKVFSKTHGKIVSELLKGHEVSVESRSKISKNHADVSGKNNPMYGKHHNKEAKQKVSQSNKGRVSHRRDTRTVYCIELDRIFKDATEAGKELGLDGSAILKCCKGVENRKTCGGYHWKFSNLENNI